jgi:molybdenum cofactor cytidylyltransferase
VSDVGIVILAAGGSARMGTPKQRLTIHGQTLLKRAARAGIEAGCYPVIVVLGASADELKHDLADLAVQIAINPDWQSGMGTSIRSGMRSLNAIAPNCNGVILALCDQPHVTSATFRQLIDTQRKTHSAICAASYAGTVGSPALFEAALFAELLQLADDESGRTVIRRHPSQVMAVPLPEAEADIDTPADYRRLADGR